MKCPDKCDCGRACVLYAGHLQRIQRHGELGAAHRCQAHAESRLRAAHIPQPPHQRKLVAAFKAAGLFLLLLTLAAPSRAQFIGYQSPQTVSQPAFTAVNVPTTFTVQNLGQNVHFLSYTVAGNPAGANTIAVQIRIEGSNDGTNFFPISDDATDPVQGEVYAIGYYPVIRANLVRFSIASGTPTLTAQYSGTSGTSAQPLGLLNPTQTGRRTFFTNAPMGLGAVSNPPVPCVYGSTAGYLIVTTSAGAVTTGTTLALTANNFATTANVTTANGSINISGLGASAIGVFPIQPIPCSSTYATFGTAAMAAGTFSAYIVFVSPNTPNNLFSPSTQPPTTLNQQVTGAVNTTTSIQISAAVVGGPGAYWRAHVYSVSARCSAGTGQLLIKDGVSGTTLWSTAAGEISTTTTTFRWEPGLATGLGNGLEVDLTTCGGGNTGTIALQASQF